MNTDDAHAKPKPKRQMRDLLVASSIGSLIAALSGWLTMLALLLYSTLLLALYIRAPEDGPRRWFTAYSTKEYVIFLLSVYVLSAVLSIVWYIVFAAIRSVAV